MPTLGYQAALDWWDEPIDGGIVKDDANVQGGTLKMPSHVYCRNCTDPSYGGVYCRDCWYKLPVSIRKDWYAIPFARRKANNPDFLAIYRQSIEFFQ